MSNVNAPTGGTLLLLRLEGLALFVFATFAFSQTGQSWWIYGLLFFVPDVSFAAYWLGSRAGAAIYNVLHATPVPIALALFGFLLSDMLMLGIAATWLAHIGFDRAMGYGLKYASNFHHTHLGAIAPMGQKSGTA